jgi:hypothetical protein
MPHVLETSEVLEEKTWQSSWETTYPQSTPLSPRRHGLSRLFAYLGALLTPRTLYHPRCLAQQMYRPPAFESPADRLARQDPFMYIKILCG